MNKILLIGCGSIGIRHIRALKAVGERNIFAFRTHKGHIKKLPADVKKGVKEIFDERETVELNPTHVIISNPTSLHLKFIKKFLKKNIRIFVEKPVAEDFADIKKLNRRTLKKIRGNKGIVGFNLRFHKIFQKIKDIVDDPSMGKPLYASLNVGHYLPFWHPYEDYRKSYAARKELGGGVLRSLSHELDLTQFLFGKIKSVFSKVEKLSELEIDVDDCVDIILTTEMCKRVKVHMDYLLPLVKRTGEILFKKALIEYDFFSGRIYSTEYGKDRRKLIFQLPARYDSNKQYQAQMRDFLSPKPKGACSLEEGIENLRVIDSCEKSQEKGRVVCLD